MHAEGFSSSSDFACPSLLQTIPHPSGTIAVCNPNKVSGMCPVRTPKSRAT